MDLKKAGLSLEEIKDLIRSQAGEFIIHVEFGKEEGGSGGRDKST